MYSSGILRNTSSSPCPNAPQNKARPARTARREKPHTMGSMTPPPPPLFPAPQAFSPRQRYFEKCQPTPCSRRQHRQAGPHKRIGFLARGNQGRYSSIVPGHWTYLYGVLAGSVKYNAGLRSRTFGSRNPALRISKGTMPAAYRRRLYCDYGCDFGYDDAPGPGCRDYPRHDPRGRDSTFAAATTPSAGTGPALFAPSRPRLRPRPPLRPFPPRPDPLRPRRPP